MDAKPFIDHYGVLDLDPSAAPDAIERQFRKLARLYHPDNLATGDRTRFDLIVAAHETLKDASRRAQYHDDHQAQLPPLPSFERSQHEEEMPDDADASLGDRVADEVGIARDLFIQNRILTLLYQQRRQHIRNPGIGNAELEHLSGCPHEHLEFHLWYLKEKRWIAVGQDGTLAITIDGVDRAASIHQEQAKKLITDQT